MHTHIFEWAWYVWSRIARACVHDVRPLTRANTSVARRLDKKTKVLFLDFTLYNDDVGLFVSCSMQVEFVSGHAPVTSVQASAISPMRFRSGRVLLRVDSMCPGTMYPQVTPEQYTCSANAATSIMPSICLMPGATHQLYRARATCQHARPTN